MAMASTSSIISPRRRASATASTIRASMPTPISSALSICWNCCGQSRRATRSSPRTSSVYGANAKIPFFETDPADHPLTFYAATKKANEEMAHSYAHLFAIPDDPAALPSRSMDRGGARTWRCSSLSTRFYATSPSISIITVRCGATSPMSPIWSRRCCISCTTRRQHREARIGAVAGDSLSPVAPWRVVNIGAGQPVELEDFVASVETGARAKGQTQTSCRCRWGMFPRPSPNTDLLKALTGYRPSTPIDVGVPRFVDWYRAHYHALAERQARFGRFQLCRQPKPLGRHR